ncbi:putative Pre-mRNA splicing factor [Zopfochytrium polystomum]|nr:putative Pre-mRNA splicing factor [Zopfochytrium polystomum]
MAFWKPGTIAPGSNADRDAEQDASFVIRPAIVDESLSMQQQRERLPIFKHRLQLLYLVEKFQVVVLVGHTGSGKTTQLPQYLFEEGWGKVGPRRIAAISVAGRVAEEMGVPLGTDVGYTVRFDDCTSERTRLRYMTDGMMFREALLDPLLTRYSVVMLDEAHERSLYTDVMIGLLKKILRKRPELRVIDKTKDTAVIVSVEGKMFPVDVQYLNQPCPDYVNKSVDVVLDIHKKNGPGDILVFLSGREEIDTVVELINENAEQLKKSNELYAVPLYSGLTAEEQLRVFRPSQPNYRKVVVATNIAEASVTIDGIVFVVDAGYVKIRAYNPKSAMESLIKQLKAMGIENVLRFDFLSPPSAESMARALEILYSLKCLDDYGRLTIPFGLQLAEFPLDPPMAAMLLNSGEYKCSEEILTIAAMLTVQNVFFQGSGQRKAAEEERKKFSTEEGDHVTFINVYNAFVNNKSPGWCRKHFLNYKNLVRAVAIRGQLTKYLKRFNVPLVSCRGDTVAIRRCILTGFFAQAAKLQYDGTYRTIREDQLVAIHPSSVLFNRSPGYVVFNEVVQTDRAWIRDVSVVGDPQWLVDAASHFYEFAKRQRGPVDHFDV